MDYLKTVIVGAGGIGKTSLMLVVMGGPFPEEYIPTVCLGIPELSGVSPDGKGRYTFAIWDTAGQEDYARLRPLSYPGTTFFLLCYSVVSEESLRRAEDYYYPEIRLVCPDTPMVLLGLKTDLLDDADTLAALANHGKRVVTPEMAQEVATRLGITKSLQISARRDPQITTDDLFRAFVVEFYPITGKKAKFRKKLLKAMHLSEPPKKPNMPHLPELKHRISPSEFAENMNYMYQVQKFTDIQFTIRSASKETASLKCHRFVLHYCCPNLLAKLDGLKNLSEDKSVTVEIECEKIIQFTNFIQLLYTWDVLLLAGNYVKNAQDIPSLLLLANEYGVDELRELIEAFRDSDESYAAKKARHPLKKIAVREVREDKGHDTDVTITSEYSSYACHRAFLMARCEYFRSMFESVETTEVSVTEAKAPVENIVLPSKMSSAKVLTLLLEYIYSDELTNEGQYDSNLVVFLLDSAMFANMYLLERLELMILCELFKSCVNKSNVITILGLIEASKQLANHFELVVLCKAMICQHFNELKATVEPEKAAQLFEYFGEIYYPPPQEQLVYKVYMECMEKQSMEPLKREQEAFSGELSQDGNAQGEKQNCLLQ